MSRKQLKDWLEIIGMIAIVGSLVFVGLEVRQNTTALIAGAYQSRSDALQQISMFIAGSETLSRIEANLISRPPSCGEFERNCEVFDDEYLASLTETEKQQYRRLLLAQSARVQNLVFQYEQGLLADDYQETILRVIEYYMPLWERFDVYQREGLLRYLTEQRSR
ncbi:hypothetical protein GWN42_05225 [candidate division KSB1 bacterium]|nr:hypothetical protein [Phycisphaerae bacterium]NIU11991.1 hypothetical protein [Phycisphaerae bacterium]NIV92205.1 hypothetical protein [candidate division KSB1 bacterium]